jgi:hypothetical protein
MTDLLTDPLFPGYLFGSFLLAGIVVILALVIQGRQEDSF